ncbi:putative acyl--CoA ligase YdaB [Musca vetustissima]|uniref:putative acyl--CoA ligase YdaB n=1 Tax=Musca vetustissima TaxID=27455 RepID=UPI002AB61AEC|nr:putative acyl--CoA ligase YdaB [Musca vetustissima]
MAMLRSDSRSASHPFLNVVFDENNKIWKSANYPYSKDTNRSVGEAFLKSMRSLDPYKVLEYHFDVKKERRAKDIFQDSVTIAVNLQRLGLRKGDVVVLFTGYTVMTSALTFGSLLIGAVVNFFEVGLNEEELPKVLTTVEPSIIFYESIFENKIKTYVNQNRSVSLKHTVPIDGPEAVVFENEFLKDLKESMYANFQSPVTTNPQEDIAFIVLTSGSTGLPKAIQLSHATVLNGMYIWWANPDNYEPLNSNSILFSLSPLRWISQVALLLQSAILGIKRICANRAATSSYGLRILCETQPTHIFSVPSFFYDILLELPDGNRNSLKSLKYIQLGGEYPTKIISEKAKLHAENARLYYSYGMSEVAGSITNDEHISGGKLQPGYQVQVLNENNEAQGYNESGRLAIKIPYKFLGYKGLGRTEYILSNGFFLNGDFGYFDRNNTLHLLARYSDLIRLIPNNVESLAMSVPNVQTARLVGFAKSPKRADQMSCLFLTLQTKSSIANTNIVDRVKAVLRSKLHSHEFDLIHRVQIIDTFPFTTCGKIDRMVLAQWARAL